MIIRFRQKNSPADSNKTNTGPDTNPTAGSVSGAQAKNKSFWYDKIWLQKFSKFAITFSIIVSAMFDFLFLNSNTILADNDDDDRYEKYEDEKMMIKMRIEKRKQKVEPAAGSQVIVNAQNAPSAAASSASSLKTRIYDTDTDGIADLFDAHPGEDDFIYRIEDRNSDGIADDLEFLKINR